MDHLSQQFEMPIEAKRLDLRSSERYLQVTLSNVRRSLHSLRSLDYTKVGKRKREARWKEQLQVNTNPNPRAHVIYSGG